MKKAVVLLSGGLDSTTCLAYAKSQGYECYALSFDYGQKHNSELEAAKRIAHAMNAARHEVLPLQLNQLTRSALTDQSIDIPDYVDDGEIPVTYVPARNTILIAVALGWAEVLEADAIFIGVSSVDYSGYPDCRPEYIEAYRKLAELATKVGVEGKPISIETPLIHLNKAETIQLGHKLGVDYGLTVSCYRANDEGEACGECDSCYLRKKGFSDAGVEDPTHYIQ
ncbi:7-cyano-7-deazaguanine synthase QueC [Zooshikella marina]|uniref:7-cyano-7-deazaguanine synthase n=1 Tax=Zooshikella ganghwensis TaxID=202772 RepID=A0A4P9VJF5_9GAMM|nr:7-cyano-7-deazaguanine synthase QueC [Zooshikella ganghwensis]MBU2707498.1 7-cyano-7-deazaguanine synthase QueC [Zooshikella ganghwensis]RDH42736.1 7-cyano-7-deazaguanine synthase QueC [Zooshikella ganghwensis]